MGETFVGVDVSKETLDIAVRPEEECWQTANTDEAFPELIARLQALEPTLIVVGATGGFERGVVAAMAEAGLPVAMINPRQSKEFAKATGRLPRRTRLTQRTWLSSAKPFVQRFDRSLMLPYRGHLP